MYNEANQYRCSIIRGKAQKDTENYIKAYAAIIDKHCPCDRATFITNFNADLSAMLGGTPTQKTIKNHRTEICGKLYGMYYEDSNGIIHEADRVTKYLLDSDMPAFFKDICYSFQFPNGSQRMDTVKEKIANNLKIRPLSFVLKFLQLASKQHVTITKKIIGYYVLNSLDVMQGKAEPKEVLNVVKRDSKKGMIQRISIPGKADSYVYQHINEQLNLLELANLIRYVGPKNNKEIVLNPIEKNAIKIIADAYKTPPTFDMYIYDFKKSAERKKMYLEWGLYYSRLSPYAASFATSVAALKWNHSTVKTKKVTTSTTDIGSEGEAIAMDYEKARVRKYNPLLEKEVEYRAKTRGIGYDIKSVKAISGPGDNDEIHIEVKTSKSIYPTTSTFSDSFNMTINEWKDADNTKDKYFIYRVYITKTDDYIYVIDNIADKVARKEVIRKDYTYVIEYNSTVYSEHVKV